MGKILKLDHLPFQLITNSEYVQNIFDCNIYFAVKYFEFVHRAYIKESVKNIKLSPCNE